jgi:hypothetical protein
MINKFNFIEVYSANIKVCSDVINKIKPESIKLFHSKKSVYLFVKETKILYKFDLFGNQILCKFLKEIDLFHNFNVSGFSTDNTDNLFVEMSSLKTSTSKILKYNPQLEYEGYFEIPLFKEGFSKHFVNSKGEFIMVNCIFDIMLFEGLNPEGLKYPFKIGFFFEKYNLQGNKIMKSDIHFLEGNFPSFFCELDTMDNIYILFHSPPYRIECFTNEGNFIRSLCKEEKQNVEYEIKINEKGELESIGFTSIIESATWNPYYNLLFVSTRRALGSKSEIDIWEVNGILLENFIMDRHFNEMWCGDDLNMYLLEYSFIHRKVNIIKIKPEIKVRNQG